MPDTFLVWNPNHHAISDWTCCKPEIGVHIFASMDVGLHCYCGKKTVCVIENVSEMSITHEKSDSIFRD